MYHTNTWKKVRDQVLRRDNYLCQESLRFGKTVQADTVHHIFPLEYYPELKYEKWNLISLNHSVHNQMHERSSHNLTPKGLALQKRYRKRYLRWCRKFKQTPHFDN